MTAPEAPDPVLIGIFETEVREGVGTFHEHLLQIEQRAPDSSRRLEDMLRLAHDLKGSARVVGYDGVARLAHALEHLLLSWRRRDGIEAAEIDRALRASDALRDLALQPADAEVARHAELQVEALESPAMVAPPANDGSETAAHGVAAVQPSPAAPARVPAATPAPPVLHAAAPFAATAHGETLRIARSSIEAVAEDVAMALTGNQRDDARAEELADALATLEAVHPPRTGAGPRELARFCVEVSAAVTRLRVTTNALRESLRQSWGHVRTLDDHARALCLVPVAPLAVHLERVVRDTAAALGRRAELLVQGRELHMDMAVVDALKAPLTHALRNAVDHGLETPEERLAAGKNPTGVLRLSFAEDGEWLSVVIRDDGRGIDRAAVRARLGDAARGADDRQLLQLLLRSGLSTRDHVTQISGRGLGLGTLAIVAEQLRGAVDMDSVQGAGTTIELRFPLRLSLLEGLVVEAGGCTYVLPTSGLAGGEVEASLSTSLAGLLGHAAAGRPAHAVSLRGRDRSVSIAVDAVRERVEVVRRSVGAHLGRVSFVEGATILHGGEPAFILDAHALAEACGGTQASSARGAPAAPAAKRVLLVDDSATLRAKLQADLTAAGFEVVLAEDGLRALERLAARRFDAIVSDVQMPRHDGFQLLAGAGSSVPFVLMTAWPDELAGQRARELGAVAYLTKDHHITEHVLHALDSVFALTKETIP